jgi:2-polyprenyl-6-methoxyphenol hydroxylase-like FAD-dependent oxidoreductase
MDDRHDVAIVGYGPVGQTLAILLGQCGWRVGVFEKQPTAYPLPRAVHFDHEVARILQAAGLGEDLPRLSEPADVYEWRNAAGQTLLRIGSTTVGSSGWPGANMFAQPDLERVLDARARSLDGVDVRRGSEVVEIGPSGDDLELAVTDADGDRHRVLARWVVGCDGANSFVRRHLGATVTDLGFFFDWLIVDAIPRQPRTWDPINLQICDPQRPTTVISGGPGRRRWEFMRLPGEDIAELNTEATAWRLLAPFDLHPGNATLERHAVYTFQARWVDRWWKRRMLLAGDAAHQMPPFAGQGMCSGIRDAGNLAWKLDLVLAGKADAALLETYASERIPQVRQAIDLSISLGKVICVADPAEAAARDAAMIPAARERSLTPPMPPPPLGPGCFLDGDPFAGHLVPQGEVRRGDVVGRFDDVVGRGFILVSPSADPAGLLAPALRAFFASLDGISVHVAPEGPVHDVNGTYARWFANKGVGVVLQRPDFHVFGTAPTVEGTTGLVRGLQAALRRTT